MKRLIHFVIIAIILAANISFIQAQEPTVTVTSVSPASKGRVKRVFKTPNLNVLHMGPYMNSTAIHSKDGSPESWSSSEDDITERLFFRFPATLASPIVTIHKISLEFNVTSVSGDEFNDSLLPLGIFYEIRRVPPGCASSSDAETLYNCFTASGNNLYEDPFAYTGYTGISKWDLGSTGIQDYISADNNGQNFTVGIKLKNEPNQFFDGDWQRDFVLNNSSVKLIVEYTEDLNASMSGPADLGYKEIGNWTANPSGASYEWKWRYIGGSWSGVASTSRTYSRTMFTTDFQVQVKVTKYGASETITRTVEYDDGGGGPCGCSPKTVADGTTGSLPTGFAIDQNFPNPFNPETHISYQLPAESHVTLTIYDITGKEVRTLVSNNQSAGHHTVTWDAFDDNGNRLTSGVYIYQIQAGDFRDAKRMTLLK